MKMFAGCMICAAVLLSAAGLSAQPKNAEDLHNGLRALKTTMEKALNKGDIDTIVAHADERVVFTTMNGDVVRGKEGVREYFNKMMTGPDRVVESVTSKFEVDDLSILHGDDMAIAFGDTEDHYVLTDGRVFDVKARWSSTMLLRGDRWVVASFHYSTNMFDNPILDAQRRYLLMGAGAVVLIVAGLAFFLGRRGRGGGGA